MKKSYTQTGASSSGEKRNNPPCLCAYYPEAGPSAPPAKGVGMMQAFLKQHRWVILAAGAAIQVDGRARGLGRVSERRVRGLFPFARERGHDFQPHHLFFRHWVYPGRPFTGQKGAAHGRACRRGAAGGGLLRRGLHPGGKSVVLLRCVQHACGAGLCVFVSFGHVLRAEVVCGPQGPGHGRHWRRGGRVRARCSRFWAAFSSAPGASAPRSGCWAF